MVHQKSKVNTISQSPTVTTAGSGVSGFDKFIDFSENMSPLGNASSLDCANYRLAMFSDLTKYVTMQNLFHDGGFSSTGVTNAVMDRFQKMIDEIYDAYIDCNQQITTDTRNIIKNDLFALKGPNFNGNTFVQKALNNGAKYAVIDEKKYYVEGKTFLVDDVLNPYKNCYTS